MAIDIHEQGDMSKLAKALQFSWSQAAPERQCRTNLIEIYRDKSSSLNSLIRDATGSSNYARGATVNLFQSYIRGVQIALAYQAPKFSVRARRAEGIGFDALLESFLNSYSCLLNFQELLRQFAMDCCFGDAIAKTVFGLAPKGVYSAVAPRVLRVNPNNFLRDRSAESVADSMFMADTYLVSLKEAQAYEEYDPAVAATLRPYTLNAGEYRSGPDQYNVDAYAEDVTRLVEVYIPSIGQILTFPAPNDSFGEVSAGKPLQVVDTPINPYSLCRMVTVSDSLAEISRLESLRELHLLANDSWSKAALQTRQSKRNPIDQIGNEQDTASILNAPDGEAVFVNEKTIDLYILPAADPQVVGMAQMASETFSRNAGNTEVAQGLSPGATTARQTNAILQQISAATAYDRSLFDTFVADIGKKLCTLAFQSESFEYKFSYHVPGTKYAINLGWAPENHLPRVGTVDEYDWEIVPMSGALRTPQERLEQLTKGSQIMAQMMMLASQGAPINIEKVLEDVSKCLDLVDLISWWSQAPVPVREQVSNTYQSLAAPPAGSQVNYSGAGGGESGSYPAAQEGAGGLAGGV